MDAKALGRLCRGQQWRLAVDVGISGHERSQPLGQQLQI
jgi:hypothetical protein